MAHRVCPWWLGYLLASPLRRLRHNPEAILAPHVHEGMTVLEPGPGMGFFTLEMARRVGETGRVVAVDVQPKMLASLGRRLTKEGLTERVILRQAAPDSMGVTDLARQVDFILAFYVVHEMPAQQAFFNEAAAALKPGGRLLLVEPEGHVTKEEFDAQLSMAGEAKLTQIGRPDIPKSRAMLFLKHA